MTIQNFPYGLTRAGVVMRPDADEPYEVEGILNPAATGAPYGRLVIFPRSVAQANWLVWLRLVRGG